MRQQGAHDHTGLVHEFVQTLEQEEARELIAAYALDPRYAALEQAFQRLLARRTRGLGGVANEG